jgi:hypothetical protein
MVWGGRACRSPVVASTTSKMNGTVLNDSYERYVDKEASVLQAKAISERTMVALARIFHKACYCECR